MILKLDKQQIRTVLEEAYARCKNDTQGKNADYIPYLAGVPATLFGIAACLPDGELLTVGDTDFAFGIESVSKVPTALLAMSQYGADTILRQIGADATGLPFNSIMAILLENDHPSTPLVNAGAIAACGLLELAACLGEAEGAPYRHAAVHLLRAMEEKFCDWDLSTDAILGMGTERYHSEQGRHIPIIYGDYFFVEAIAKLTGHWTRSW